MNTLLFWIVSVGILSTGCNQKDESKQKNVTSMSVQDCDVMLAAVRSQYNTILTKYHAKESLLLRLEDHSASLTMTLQNNTIVMVQLILRNPYPNAPDMAPTPYTDIHGDGLLETYPADTKTLPESSLTYGNYLALLTRFSIPSEVVSEKSLLQDSLPHKTHKLNIARDSVPPSSTGEIFSRIAQ